jgi:hypothetical protein
VPDSAKRVELQNSDQLDHLVGCQDKDELAIIGARSLTSAAELALLERRGWIGHGEVADLLGRPSAIGGFVVIPSRCTDLVGTSSTKNT